LNDTDSGKQKSVPEIFCQQICAHGLAWDRTVASAMRGRQVT